MKRAICRNWLACLGCLFAANVYGQEMGEPADGEGAPPPALAERAWIAPATEAIQARVVHEAAGRNVADTFLWLDSAQKQPIAYRVALDPKGQKLDGLGAPGAAARGALLSVSRASGALKHGHLAQLRSWAARKGWHSYQIGLAFDDTAAGDAQQAEVTLERIQQAVAFVQQRHPSTPLALVIDASVEALGAQVATLGVAALILLNPASAAHTDALPQGLPVLAIWVTPARVPVSFTPTPTMTGLRLPKSSSTDPASLVPRRLVGWLTRNLG